MKIAAHGIAVGQILLPMWVKCVYANEMLAATTPFDFHYFNIFLHTIPNNITKTA